MADTKKVIINVTDEGSLAKVESGARDVNAQLKNIAKNSEAASKTLGNMKAATVPRSASVAAKQSESTNDMLDYKLTRGITGATGAAGRDFAKQSQGLGGLVHVYATFAANLFAVSAAFMALRNAADTTNLIKGLDQLGAASGRNLGGISKQVAALTDNAISLREAMVVVAQSTAAGMSSKNVERLALAARNTSQALGIGMGDAISRLSRGITKLEPELLDELGIFVRVDKAAQDYARSIGKTASQLTDFEKRQGFANAVLAQAEEKFGAIKIDSNPYSKLLATFADVTQKGLEFVNKVLGPIAKFLAESPTAVAGVIAAVGGILTKMAIPQISNWQAGLKQEAAMAKEFSTKANIAYAEYQNNISRTHEEAINKRMATEKQAVSKALASVQSASSGGVKSGKLFNLLRSDLTDKADQDAAYKLLDTQIKRAQTISSKIAETSVAEKQLQEGKVASLKAARAELDKYISTLRKYQAELAQVRAAEEKQDFHGSVMQKLSTSAANKYRQLEILSDVSQNTQHMGIKGAWQALNNQIKGLTIDGMDSDKKALTGWTKYTTLVRGSLGIMTTAVSTAVSAFGIWGAAIGVVTMGLGALYDYLSNTKQEALLTAEAVEKLASANDSASRTLEFLGSKNNSMSVEGLQARANAMLELADTTKLFVDRSIKELNKLEGVSAIWNTIKSGLFGFDSIEQKMAKDISTTLTNAIKLAGNGSTKATLTKEINKIFPQLNLDSLDTLKEQLLEIQKSAGSEKFSELAVKLVEVSNSFSVSAAKGTELKASVVETNKALDTFLNSTIPSDPLSKVGLGMISTAQKMSSALADSEQSLNTMVNMSGDLDFLKLLPTDMAKGLMELNPALKTISAGISGAESAITRYKDEIKSLEKEKISADDGTEMTAGRVADIEDRITEIRKAIINAQTAQATFQADTLKYTSTFQSAISASFVQGANIVSSRISAEWAKAGSIMTNAVADLLQGTEAAVRMRGEAERSQNSAQAEVIKSQVELANRVYENSLLVAESNALKKLEAAKTDNQIGSAQREVDTTSEAIKRFKSLKGSVVKGTAAELTKELAADSTKDLQGLISYAQQVESAMAQLAQIGAANAASRLKEEAGIIDIRYKKTADILNLEKERNQLELDKLSLADTYGGALSEELIKEKEILQTRIAQANAAEKASKIDAQIEKLNLGLSKVNPNSEKDRKKVEEVQALIKRLETEKGNIVSSTETAILKLGMASSDQIRNLSEARVKATFEASMSGLEANNEVAKEHLQTLKDIKFINSEYLVDLESGIKATELTLSFDKRRFELTKQLSDLKYNFEQRTQALGGNREAAGEATYNAERNALQAQLDKEQLIFNTKKASLELTKSYTEDLARQKDITEILVGMTADLGVIFGQMGAAVGGVVTALNKLVDEQKNLNKEKAIALKIDKDSGGTKQAQIEYEYNIKIQKAELAGYAATAAASKKLFKEKTAAYKVLDAMEKAASFARIALALEEWAVKAGLIAQQITAETSKEAVIRSERAASAAEDIAITTSTEAGKQAVKAPTVIEEFMAWLGPWGMAAGVAALAAIGISMGGKGSKSTTFTPNASQRQEVQGTGSGWDSKGRKIQTSRGVFGDDEAKSESVVNSLEIIKNNSIDGLSYDNKVVLLLSKINEGINNSAKSLYSISGIRTGSMFNTIEGTKSSGGILGLFTSKISTAISDAGIVINGSFIELASDITKSAIKFYEDVVVTKKTWYGKTSSYNQRNIEAIDDPTAEYFKQIFMNATQMFVDIGKGAGIMAEDVIKSLSTVKFADQSASLRGLKGEELEKELTSIVSSMLDKGAEAIFKQFENFANFGEGMLETVVRVTDINTKIKQALSNIGISSIADTTGMASYTITEALSTWAGGLDKFLEINKSYADKFLSESEKLAPIQKAVTSEMSKLGLSGVTTRDQFKQLVQALDLTVPSQQALYTRLMAVSEGFYAVTEAADSTSTANNDKRNLEIELMKLTGRTLEATIAERQLELASIDDSLKALQREVYFRTDLVDLQNKLFDTTLTQAEKLKKTREEELAATNDLLKPIVKYTHAMQDVASAKEELTKAYEKESQQISSTISKLTSASQSLKDFRNSLLSGASSTLTPQQKYEQTRNALNTNIAIANSTPTTEAERLAQETAISKISSLSQEFLAASQVWNASSSKYTDDFNYVLGITGSLSDSLDLQASEAQKTLDAMKQQVTSLGYVETALVSTRDAIETLTNAINTANSLKPASDLAQQVLPDFTSIATGIIDAATGTTLDTAIAIASATATATIMEMITPVTQQISDYINVANSVVAATASTPTTPTVSAVDSASSGINFSYLDSGAYGAAATGGKVSGITMVGELGPELVDFTQPGRVYTAEQTKGMFAANDSSGGTSMAQAIQSLTREVQYLNKEVAQLRKEQNQQTGALIASNYDANQRAADTISETVETTATETQWAERSKVKVS